MNTTNTPTADTAAVRAPWLDEGEDAAPAAAPVASAEPSAPSTAPKPVTWTAPEPDHAGPLAGPYAVWTAAAVHPNPGPGAGVAVVRNTAKGGERIACVPRAETTAPRAQLEAVLAGLRALHSPSRVTVHVADAVVFQGVAHHMAEWERAEWRNRKGARVRNADLWQMLRDACRGHALKWVLHPADAAPEDTLRARKVAAEGVRKARAMPRPTPKPCPSAARYGFGDEA